MVDAMVFVIIWMFVVLVAVSFYIGISIYAIMFARKTSLTIRGWATGTPSEQYYCSTPLSTTLFFAGFFAFIIPILGALYVIMICKKDLVKAKDTIFTVKKRKYREFGPE